MTGADIVNAARLWLGTPFHHQGRVRGAGVDCVGLVIGVAQELGLANYDFTGYGRLPEHEVMGRELRANMDTADTIVSGSVLWFAFSNAPQHLGIVTDNGLIHAFSRAGKVVETGLDHQWIERNRGIFRFRGVDYG